MAKKLPTTLYVKIEKDGTTEYFVADDEMYGLVEKGDRIKIGTYELVETTMAEAIVKTSPPVKR
jgi:hypothetical protein